MTKQADHSLKVLDTISGVVYNWVGPFGQVPHNKNITPLPPEYQTLEVLDIYVEQKINSEGKVSKFIVSSPKLSPAESIVIFRDNSKSKPDPINSPSHYRQGSIEVFDFIEDQKMNYTEGAIIKYVSRYKYKGKPLEDLQKAAWYLNKLIEKEKNARS